MAKKAAAVNVNPFDSIATTTTPAKAKATKPTAKVTAAIKAIVDKFIAAKAALNKVKVEMAEYEASIIEHVRPQQDELARQGSFTKSLTVPGEVGSVLYSTSDKFSSLTDPLVIDHVKDLIGDEKFNEYFEKVRSISLKQEVLEDKIFIAKLVDAVSKAGLTMAEAFVVTDSVRAKPGLDEKQYALDEAKLAEFRELVKQNKPALK